MCEGRHGTVPGPHTTTTTERNTKVLRGWTVCLIGVWGRNELGPGPRQIGLSPDVVQAVDLMNTSIFKV